MYRFRLIAFFAVLAVFGAIAINTPRPGFAQESNQGIVTQLNCDEEPCDAVPRGQAAFNRRNLKKLGGNSRACADCHMPSESFQLSPSAARARFDALQAKREHRENADDPLFRPVDADDFRVNGENAKDFSNLVENGLIRVTMPLPANVKLIDPTIGQPSDETFVDLWRAVPPVLNVAITGPDGGLPIWPPGAPRSPIMSPDSNGPNRQGGYQIDARFATLRAQVARPPFTLSRIDRKIVKKFHEAWSISSNGSSDAEGVVLIFLNADGSYRGVRLGRTNEKRKATFKWDPDVIAVIHTHPSRFNPEPGGEDISLADRFGVPIFTITLKGMFMYDPTTKKISKVKESLDWLDQSRWPQLEYVATKQQ